MPLVRLGDNSLEVSNSIFAPTVAHSSWRSFPHSLIPRMWPGNEASSINHCTYVSHVSDTKRKAITMVTENFPHFELETCFLVVMDTEAKLVTVQNEHVLT